MRDHLVLFLNGRPHRLRGADAFRPLTDWLRRELALTGTKVICNEGDCGACTVLVGRPGLDGLAYHTADSCLLAMYQLDGCHVVTVEGLTRDGRPHGLQQAMIDRHASQCGYCTPGFVMALAGACEAGVGGDREAQRIALTGNVCRCTGYLPLLDAAADVCAAGAKPVTELYASDEMTAECQALSAGPVRVTDGRRVFFAPVRREDALAFKSERPEAVVVAGGTELGVWRNKRGDDPPALLSLARVPGLHGFSHGDPVVIGANATWAELGPFAERYAPALLPIIRRFGSPQVRNLGTLVGNVANGSPIADSLCFLMARGAEVRLASVRGERSVPIDRFYTGYKTKDLAPDEIITGVSVPAPVPGERLALYKVSKRLDMDIATFGAGVRLRLAGNAIERAWVAYSGVAPTVLRLRQTEACLAGKPFAEATFAAAGRVARGAVSPISDVRGGRDFRLTLAENVLRKFYHEQAGPPAEANGVA
jgi:xanthine dehydrogenase small subunit